MRIAFVLTALGSGGTERWVELASGELVRRGHQVTVIVEHPPHTRVSKVEHAGATVHAFDAPDGVSQYARLLREARVEVVHLHVWERSEELSELGRLVDVPLLLSYHHVPPRPLRIWAARVVKPWRMPGLARRFWSVGRNVDAHVACCHLAAAGVRGELWPFLQRRVHCVPNGVAMPGQRAEGGCTGPPHFVQVGALVERKNPEATLRAFSGLDEGCPEAELTFVGDGPLRSKLEITARRLSNDHRKIRIVGQVEDVGAFYETSNVAVLSSEQEGLPYSLLEAAAHGLALIATDVGGNREVTVPGRTGMLVPPGDHAALSRAMTNLAVNPDIRAEMGRNARGLVQERFTLDAHVDNLLALYTRLSQRRKPAQRFEDPKSKAREPHASSREIL